MTRILIAGAGIAGLTCALALHSQGECEVTVFEQAPQIRPLGSGVNLMPQATRHFADLGVLDDLRRVAIATSTMQMATAHGQILWSEHRGGDPGSASPQLSIHRGWLTRTLIDHVRDRLGPGSIVPGARLVDIDTRCRTATFIHPDGPTLTETFDIFIGADGIRSATREVVRGEPTALQFAGATVWRGVTRFDSFADGATMVIAGDGNSKVVFYPLARHDDGTSLMNWAAATPESHGGSDRGNWNTAASADEFASHFSGWRIHGIDIEELMRSTDLPFAYPMVDIDPLTKWTRGPITLIGDAAHAMYPIGSNGATQSVIDAAVLARHIKSETEPQEGLIRYESERRPATTAIQEANRALGPEVVIDLAAQRAPHGFAELSDVFAPGELERIAGRYAEATGAPTPIRSQS
ncbi:FAD-dependent monooxygenase [Rhodococcus qingshengii]|uniref:FAD-dependent monooxygenase n=1 Tax=Rhodococcus qingshengii TaxID=334542 RepID=UPI0010A5CF39|nr:FAD-dependent monooxygenase [Rhodococcus qingshengii]THJ67654.1 FAD-binding protein [Rhodococcus qingshengii]